VKRVPLAKLAQLVQQAPLVKEVNKVFKVILDTPVQLALQEKGLLYLRRLTHIVI
jgi:hypothetical protein